MNEIPRSTWRVFGAVGATVLGVAFFFVIIGVFGLPASVVALVLFVTLTIAISLRPQTGGRRP